MNIRISVLESERTQMTCIRTVIGDIAPPDLGITLSHEHVFLDLKCWWYEPEEATLKLLAEEPLRVENYWALRYRPEVSKDNIKLYDEHLAVQELLEFKRNGGSSLVDLTLPGIGRDYEALARISRITGLNIVMGTGWYVERSHPSHVKRKSSEDLAAIMVREIEDGIGETGIRAGVIGEIACSSPLPFHSEEKKVLSAACKAQVDTGVALTLHPAWIDYPNRKIVALGETYLDFVEKRGTDLGKFYLSHGDYTYRNIEYLRKILDRGIMVDFDTFGCEVHYDNVWPGLRLPTDPERIEVVVELCKMGYDKQLMVAQDMSMKMMLKRYGGYGYSHVLEHIVPELRRQGVSQKQIRNILVENPRKMLSF